MSKENSIQIDSFGRVNLFWRNISNGKREVPQRHLLNSILHAQIDILRSFFTFLIDICTFFVFAFLVQIRLLKKFEKAYSKP